MDTGKEVVTLNIDDVLPNRFQPRIKFNEKNILELADSIREHGVIQPIVVRKISDKYEIIAGERRYKASILAGKTTIPAIITNFDDKQSAEVALIENVQRQDLTPIEEAISYKKILDMGYINQTDLAEKLGKTQSTVANKLRLLNLSDEVQEALLEEKISERHARSLLKLDNDKQVELLDRIINERMTVRKTDEEIKKILDGSNDETAALKAKNPFNVSFDNKEEPKVENISNSVLKTEPTVSSFFSELNNNKNEELMDNPFANPFNDKEESLTREKEDSEFEIVDFEEEPLNENKREENRKEGEIEMNQNNMFNPFVNQNINNGQSQVESNQNNMFNNNQFNMPSTPIQENNIGQNENIFNSYSSIDNQISQPVTNNVSQSIENIESDESGNQGGRFFGFAQPNMSSTNVENPQIQPIEQTSPQSQNVNTFDQFNPFVAKLPEQEEVSNPFGNSTNNAEISNPFVSSVSTSTENINPFIDNTQPSIQPTPLDNSVINQLQPENPSNTNMGTNINPFAQQEMPSISQMNNGNSQASNSTFNNNPFGFSAPEQELVNNQLKPFSLDDGEQFVNQSSVEISPQNPFTKNEYTINEEPPAVVKPMEQNTVAKQADLRTVINTIRNCSETIEKYGYIVETEEIDFEDSYQVIFKIQK